MLATGSQVKQQQITYLSNKRVNDWNGVVYDLERIVMDVKVFAFNRLLGLTTKPTRSIRDA
jgi:hypothetical protein